MSTYTDLADLDFVSDWGGPTKGMMMFLPAKITRKDMNFTRFLRADLTFLAKCLLPELYNLLELAWLVLLVRL